MNKFLNRLFSSRPWRTFAWRLGFFLICSGSLILQAALMIEKGEHFATPVIIVISALILVFALALLPCKVFEALWEHHFNFRLACFGLLLLRTTEFLLLTTYCISSTLTKDWPWRMALYILGPKGDTSLVPPVILDSLLVSGGLILLKFLPHINEILFGLLIVLSTAFVSYLVFWLLIGMMFMLFRHFDRMFDKT